MRQFYSSAINRPLTIDTSGDFIAWAADPVSKLINSATYGTLFDFRRSNTLPDVDFSTSRGTIPSQPQPVPLGPTSFLGSWFSFNQTKTGEQIDELCVFALLLYFASSHFSSKSGRA
jgi:syntaxin-binding protein 5